MLQKRIHVSLSPAQLRLLDKLAKHLQLDRTNTLRFCLARIAKEEGIKE